jgi:hypothetical protein
MRKERKALRTQAGAEIDPTGLVLALGHGTTASPRVTFYHLPINARRASPQAGEWRAGRLRRGRISILS